MAQQDIIIGPANQGQGDTLFDAFTKVQSNFDELYADDAGDVNSVNAGTGISENQTTGAVTVTNSAPDQTVSLTGGTAITTSGTYPNFTITNSSPNATHTGEVTGSGALTIASDVITQDKLANQFKTTLTNGSATGSVSLDFNAYQVFDMTLSGTTTFGITNAEIGMVKDLYVTGVQTFSITNGKSVAGTYDGSVVNLIQIVAQTPTSFWYSISQEQV